MDIHYPTFEPSDNLATLLHQRWIKLIAYRVETVDDPENDSQVATLEAIFTNGRRYYRSDISNDPNVIEGLVDGPNVRVLAADDLDDLVDELLRTAVEIVMPFPDDILGHFIVANGEWQYTDAEVIERVGLETDDVQLSILMHRLSRFVAEHPYGDAASHTDPGLQVASAAVAYAWSQL